MGSYPIYAFADYIEYLRCALVYCMRAQSVLCRTAETLLLKFTFSHLALSKRKTLHFLICGASELNCWCWFQFQSFGCLSRLIYGEQLNL